jgi:hypothetical protein
MISLFLAFISQVFLELLSGIAFAFMGKSTKRKMSGLVHYNAAFILGISFGFTVSVYVLPLTLSPGLQKANLIFGPFIVAYFLSRLGSMKWLAEGTSVPIANYWFWYLFAVAFSIARHFGQEFYL